MCPMSFKIGQLHYFWIVCYLQQSLSHWEECSYNIPFGSSCRENLNLILTLFLLLPLCSLSSCHVCGFQTELNAQFVSHMSLHVDKEQWMFSLCCSVCDYVCMEETDMRNHISTGHAGTDSWPDFWWWQHWWESLWFLFFVCLYVYCWNELMISLWKKMLGKFCKKKKEKIRSNSSAKHQIFTQFAFCFFVFSVFPKQKKLTLWWGWNIRLYCFSLLLCLISCWLANVSCVLAYCCHVTRSFLNDSHVTVSLLVCSPRV